MNSRTYDYQKMMVGFDLDVGSLYGDPQDNTRASYDSEDLISIRKRIENTYPNLLDLNNWIKKHEQILPPIFWDIFEEIIPERTVLEKGIVIESDPFHRNKHKGGDNYLINHLQLNLYYIFSLILFQYLHVYKQLVL